MISMELFSYKVKLTCEFSKKQCSKTTVGVHMMRYSKAVRHCVG
jgi:hypothetical protein